MPYKKKYGYKKKKAPVTKAVKSYVKHALRVIPEWKENSIASTYATNYDSVIGVIIAPSQGTDFDERIGDSIVVRRMTFSFQIIHNITVPVEDVVRIIIFNDKMNNISTGNLLLQSSGSSLAVFSPIDIDAMERIHVLYDKTFAVIPSTSKASMVSKIIKNMNLKCDYVNGGATPNKNVLKYAFISQNVTGIGANPRILGNFTCMYTDV